MKTTVICHIFNEEYLLPFWLEHHRTVFDHGVIIDYHSTDGSVALVHRLCPTWTVRTSRNLTFDAAETDREVMDVEAGIEGIKVALNVTEFVFPKEPLRCLFGGGAAECFRMEALTPVSDAEAEAEDHPASLGELLAGVRRVARGHRMGHRFVHSHPTGRYTVGRHSTALESRPLPSPDSVVLLWFGFYPWNSHVLRRKLQIMANIPSSDVEAHFDIMRQHAMTRQQMEDERRRLSAASEPWSLEARKHTMTMRHN